MGLAFAGCVFTPPPPLPEELAATEAEKRARAEQVNAGQAADPSGGEEAAFKAGDEPALGMTPAQMQAYAKAQGDPEGGDFTIEEALAELPGQGELWARFVTEQGTLECHLFEEQTPITVANFVGLARGLRPSRDPRDEAWTARPYYDGTLFHRVIPGFMIQGGDPTGTGRGGTGYVIPDEFSPMLRHERAGMLSMANRGPGTGSAQFFITLAPTPHLDDKHTVFGECTEASVDVAEAIAAKAGPDDRPDPPQVLQRVEILRVPAGQAVSAVEAADRPAREARPPTEARPGTEGEAPGTEGEAPGTEGEAPGTEGEAPGTGGEAPRTGGSSAPKRRTAAPPEAGR